LNDEGINGEKKLPVRFLGIWDTVASFGLPGNDINLGKNLTLPDNVAYACHGMALDERRDTFPLTRITRNSSTARMDANVHEVWFRGYHSDIGGGNKNEALSSIPLVWMFRHAARQGIEFLQSDINAQLALSDQQAECKTPGIDLVADECREVLVTDLVHDTVSARQKADRFDANNPPDGITVMNDSGEVLA